MGNSRLRDWLFGALWSLGEFIFLIAFGLGVLMMVGCLHSAPICK